MHFAERISRLSLRQLLSLAMLPLMVLTGLATGGVTAWMSSQEVAQHHVRLGEQMTKTLAQHSDLALLYESADSLADTTASLLANPMVLEIRVLGRDGKVIYQQRRNADDAWHYPDGTVIAMNEAPDAWLFSSPVSTAGVHAVTPMSPELALLDSSVQGNGEVLGQVQLALGKADLFEARRSIFLTNLGVALSSSLLLALAVLGVLRRVSRPLETLADTMHAAREGVRIESEQVRLGGVRELREIGQSYDALMNVIRQREQALQEINQHLEERIQERTQALQIANRELEAFSYSVSHDLRAPLRAIHGFSQALLTDYASTLDSTGKDYLGRICKGVCRMGELIDDMLLLARVTRHEMQCQPLDMSALACEVDIQLREQFPDRDVVFKLTPDLQVQADPKLLRIALDNLLGNAWKYTGKLEHAEVEFTKTSIDGETVFVVSDNGAGFDMRFADKLFGAFQRLHGKEFDGTGVGLATVQRILSRHGGRIWANSEVGKGARFYFTLPE